MPKGYGYGKKMKGSKTKGRKKSRKKEVVSCPESTTEKRK